MKNLVILFAVCFVSAKAIDPKLVQDFLEIVTRFGTMCVEEEKASNEDVAVLMQHKIPESHEGKCVISCVYKKFKIQNPDGTMNHQQIMVLIEKVKEQDAELYEKMTSVVDNCHKPEFVVADQCETAVNVAKCAAEEAKKAGISAEMLGI